MSSTSKLLEQLSLHLNEGSRESFRSFFNSALGHLPLLLNYDPIHLYLGVNYLQADPARLSLYNLSGISLSTIDKERLNDKIEIPTEVKRYAIFSKLAYTKKSGDFLPKLKCHYSSIRLCLEVPSTHFWPEHYLIIDEEEKAIVLVIRGTKELSDFANDAFAMPVPLHNRHGHEGSTELKTSSETETDSIPRVHCGIKNVVSALLQPGYLDGSEVIGGLWIGGAVANAKDGEGRRLFNSNTSIDDELSYEAIRNRKGIACVIQKLINQLGGGYSIFCVGHSLGAGISSLLVMELRRMLIVPTETLPPTDGLFASSIYSGIVKQNPIYAIGYGMPSTSSADLACLASLTHRELENLFCDKIPSEMSLPTCKWKGAARMHLPMITTVIIGDDIVPRMSLDALSHLNRVISDPIISAEIRTDAFETSARHIHAVATNFVETHVPQKAVALVGTLGNQIGNHIETLRQSSGAAATGVVINAVGNSVNFLASMASQHIGSAASTIATASVARLKTAVSGSISGSILSSSTLSTPLSTSTTMTTDSTTSSSLYTLKVPLDDKEIDTINEKNTNSIVEKKEDTRKEEEDDEDEEDLLTPIRNREGDLTPRFAPLQEIESDIQSMSISSTVTTSEKSLAMISEIKTLISLYINEWILANVGKEQKLVPPGRIYHFSRVEDESKREENGKGNNLFCARLVPPRLFQYLALSQTYLSDHSCAGYVKVLNAC
jgi:hypothetical protein